MENIEKICDDSRTIVIDEILCIECFCLKIVQVIFNTLSMVFCDKLLVCTRLSSLEVTVDTREQSPLCRTGYRCRLSA